MASSEAEGKFSGAIPQSSIGGLNGGKPYSEYYTIPKEMDVAGSAILAQANCTNATSPVDCLRALDTFALLTLGTIAWYIVVDGTYITSDHLPLDRPGASYSLLMGIMHDGAGALIAYPDTSDETACLDEIGWAAPPGGLFPIVDPSNGTNTNNATLDLWAMATQYTTDGMLRCTGQATAYSGLAHGIWDRVYCEFERSNQLADWPGYQMGFREERQCDGLGLPLTYWE